MKPSDRLREAVKQLEIASEEIDVIYSEIDEAAIRIRGLADRLEEREAADRELTASEIVDGSEDSDVQEAIDDATGGS